MYFLFLYCLHEESYISKLRGREQRDPGIQHPNSDPEITALDSIVMAVLKTARYHKRDAIDQHRRRAEQ